MHNLLMNSGLQQFRKRGCNQSQGLITNVSVMTRYYGVIEITSEKWVDHQGLGIRRDGT